MKYSKDVLPVAKHLRKTMTKQERKLWYDFLRCYSPRFLRQKPIDKYVADFYCAQAMLVIELDGSGHGIADQMKKDESRTRDLNEFGIMVMRIQNSSVEDDFEIVCAQIDQVVRERIRTLSESNKK